MCVASQRERQSLDLEVGFGVSCRSWGLRNEWHFLFDFICFDRKRCCMFFYILPRFVCRAGVLMANSRWWQVNRVPLWQMQGRNSGHVSFSRSNSCSKCSMFQSGAYTDNWKKQLIYFLSHLCNTAAADLLARKCLPIQKIKIKAFHTLSCMPSCVMLSIYWQQIKRKRSFSHTVALFKGLRL